MGRWESIAVALAGKGGIRNFMRRLIQIIRCYGLSPARVSAILDAYIAFIQQWDFRATFPIVATVAQRYPALLKKYQAQGVEFAVHGYSHTDHRHLSAERLKRDLAAARQIFAENAIVIDGFRAPYLRMTESTLTVLKQEPLGYDSSQGLFWDVLQGAETAAYHYVLDFYGALPVRDYMSLPSIEGSLVRIPYSLPDDEALVYRLGFDSAKMSAIWEAVLQSSYESGELFVLGLHPERFLLCREALAHTLSAASRLVPHVWGATLAEVASWWRARLATTVTVSGTSDTGFTVNVAGPQEVTLLARAVDTNAPTAIWKNGYVRLLTTTCRIASPVRPLIGAAPGCSPALVDFLRQQGYIVEVGGEAAQYAYYFDAPDFVVTQARALLAHIETTTHPLVRLGRWPAGAHSALCISGDIDALSIMDYIRRLFEN